jgi:hypothetical protein
MGSIGIEILPVPGYQAPVTRLDIGDLRFQTRTRFQRVRTRYAAEPREVGIIQEQCQVTSDQ